MEVDEWKGKYTELSSTLEATMNNLEQQIKTLSVRDLGPSLVEHLVWGRSLNRCVCGYGYVCVPALG